MIGQLRDALKKNPEKYENLSQIRDPPIPPVWEPHVCEKKKNKFVLQFRTFFVFVF